jgi:hypothetical protein
MEKCISTLCQKTMDLDMVPDATLSWVGAGFFTQYTLSNTGQNGVFEPPPGWKDMMVCFLLVLVLIMDGLVNFQKVLIHFMFGGAGLWVRC